MVRWGGVNSDRRYVERGEWRRKGRTNGKSRMRSSGEGRVREEK